MLKLFNIWLSVAPKSSKVRAEVWRRFCTFTSSDEYIKAWESLYDAVEIEKTCILSFYIMLRFFYRTWQYTHPTTTADDNQASSSNEIQHLTYDEQNALWYVAGYILRKVRKQLEKRKGNDDNLAILESFKEDSMDDGNETDSQADEAEEIQDSRAWLRMIDRGGLTKCTNDFIFS